MVFHAPTRLDVQCVRSILRHQCGLPNELVLLVLDHARYWVECVDEHEEYVAILDSEWSHDSSHARLYFHLRPFVPPVSEDELDEEQKIKEIEFLVVSHDQGPGWPYISDSEGESFETSSWTEVSILRPRSISCETTPFLHRVQAPEDSSLEPLKNIYSATQHDLFLDNYMLVPRPSREPEPQRLHCTAMQEITYDESESLPDSHSRATKEGDHAWFLQGNEVGRGTSIFEGEMVPRYRIVWGSTRWLGNQGTGSGNDFIECLQPGDRICVWIRAKRKGWENHVYGVRVTIRYDII